MTRILPSRLLGALFATVLSAAALTAAPAEASGTGSPVVVSPTNGQTVAQGFAGPYAIDFSNAPLGYYEVEVLDATGNAIDYDYVDGDGVVNSYITVPQAPGQYHIRVYGNGVDTTSAFSVAPPTLSMTNVSVSPTTFNPRVRDGYRDNATIRYRLNAPAAVTAQVRNARGSVVRSVTLGSRSGSTSWVWNGRSNSNVVPPNGVYTIQLTARQSETGVVRTTSGRVTLTSGVVTQRTTKSRSGYSNSSQSKRGNCSIDFFDYDSTVELDCWAGVYAQVGYNFAVPANARNITWAVSGRKGCCDDGRTIKSGVRATRTLYRVNVKVTNWHAYTVHSVRVTYTYSKRV